MATPKWASAQGSRVAASAQINQLLGTHNHIEIYEGAINTASVYVNWGATQIAIGSTLSPYFPLGDVYNIGPFTGTFAAGSTKLTPSTSFQSNAIDQPIVMSGTEIDRVTMPLSIANGVGQDVMVSLQTDSTPSGGLPSGTVIAQTLVPKEFLAAANLPAIKQGFTSVNSSPASILPPYPINIFNNQSVATDGTYVAVVGGSGTVLSQFQSTPVTASALMLDAINGVGPWTVGAPLPTPGIFSGGLSYAAGYLILTGGEQFPAGGSTVLLNSTYTAAFVKGVISSWVKGPNLPEANVATQAQISITSVQTGIANTIPTIFVIGGFTGPNNIADVTMATLSSSGSLSAFTQVTSYPVPADAVGVCYINGWLVTAGGFGTIAGSNVDLSTTYAAKVNVDSSGNVTLGPWQNWPSIPPQNPTNSPGVNGVSLLPYGNTVFAMGGTLVSGKSTQWFALTVLPTGPVGGWVQLLAGSAVTTSNVVVTSSGIAFGPELGGVGNQNGILAQLLEVGMISIPLKATGLTNGATYHIVVSGIGGDPDNYSQVMMGTIPSGQDALTSQNGGTWQHTQTGPLQSGTSIPVQVYNGNTGHIVHTVEDVGLPKEVQGTQFSTTTTSTTFAANWNASQVGTTLIAYVIDRSTASAFTLPAPWITIFSDLDNVNHTSQLLAYYPNNPGGITSVTATRTTITNDNLTFSLLEFSGVGLLDVAAHSMNNAANTTMSFTSPPTQQYDFVLACFFDEVADGTTITAGAAVPLNYLPAYTQIAARFGQCFLEFTSWNSAPVVTASATNSASHVYGGGVACFLPVAPAKQTWQIYTNRQSDTVVNSKTIASPPTGQAYPYAICEQVGSVRRLSRFSYDSTLSGNATNNVGSGQGWGIGQYGAGSAPALMWGE